jgi:hypothetical protein
MSGMTATPNAVRDAAPGDATVGETLDRAATRTRRIALLRGAAAGAIAATIALLGRFITATATDDGRELAPEITSAIVLLPIAVGVAVAFLRSRGNRAHAAAMVERRAPHCRNLLITADELQRTDRSSAVAPDVANLVSRQAAALARTIDVDALFPSQHALRELAVASALLVAALVLPRAREELRAVTGSARAADGVPGDAISRIDVTVRPPAYAGGSAQRSTDPARVDALVDSRIRVAIRSGADSVRVTTADGPIPVRPASDGTFNAEFRVVGDGFIVVEAVDSVGARGRRLIGVTARRDNAPRVRVVTPARDLVLQNASQSIALMVEADDDLALSTLRLRYTKVSGSGERFTFEEGEVPLQITRRSARAWNARVNWNLSGLALTTGDMVVYRAVAADRRPGAAPSESDAFIAQLLSKEGDAAPGFAVDPDEERQALSQQMVILKTERLIARQRTIPPAALAEEARNLAVEQRRVRAEFVFMMGGELSEEVASENSMGDLDESHEAEAESDLSAGRLANQGRTALLAAIRAMSRASTALNSGDLATALPEERNAVAQLERAFSRSRYLLRALTQREQLDMTRRGTGALTDASRDLRPVAVADRNTRVVALRGALGDLVSIGGDLARSGTERGAAADISTRISATAERVLRTDPSAPALQKTAEFLALASRAVAAGRDDARMLLDRATGALSAVLRAEAGALSRGGASVEERRLVGALSDAADPREASRASRTTPARPR